MSISLRKSGFTTGSAATLAGAAALAVSFTMPAMAADFYSGKNVELTIGANPGGGYDSYARITARHIATHIPGKPTIIPRNRPGAGSRKALNWFFDGAPKNGNVFGAFYPGALIDPLIRPKRSTYDVTKLNFLGSVNKTARQCIARKDAKVQKFEDLFTHELAIGATSRGGSTRDYALMMNNVLGTKFKVISGYKGSKGILLSIERNETQGLCGYAWSSLKKAKPNWAKGEFINVLVQTNLKPHAGMSALGAPMLQKYIKTKKQRQIVEFFLKQHEFGRPYAMPPGSPKKAVNIMRDAATTTWASKAFLKSAEKARLDVNPISSQEIHKLLKELFALPKPLIKEIVAITKKKKKKT
ncbi:MAG: tripartite-type tricarboxylate transporter receptor subunit TctC [Alphaproteobacteria bacterium]|jgi:tripartite-type tricarboxylate transporter receptor subunit TctC